MTRTADGDLLRVVASAAAGDEDAFARIVAAYHGEMQRVCVVVARDHAMAEAAVRAAWLVAWRKLGKIHDPERVRPWLVSIAVREVRQLLRKQRRRPPTGMGAGGTGAPGGFGPATVIGSLDVRIALEGLDPDDRALLAMRYLLGFDEAELSTALGSSASKNQTRLEQVLLRLRRELSHG